MSGFKGGRKYLIYIFIAGWMFFLGIMTGRGTIPVKFDTVNFTDRLAAIAESLTKGKKSEKKLKLDFYHGLINDSLIIKIQETGNKRQETRDKKQDKASKTAIRAKPEPAPDPKPSPEPASVSQAEPIPEAKRKLKSEPGHEAKPEPQKQLKDDKSKIEKLYTLQVAAYPTYKEALAKMADLKEMGFGSYHEETQKAGKVWYRVRIGTFPSLHHAKIAKNLLIRAGIDSIIMRKD